MRQLSFIVDGQELKRDPNCDFSGLVAGSSNYIDVHFTFSDEWEGCNKAVTFYANDMEKVIVLDASNICAIPRIITDNKKFALAVSGLKGNILINTGKAWVHQV